MTFGLSLLGSILFWGSCLGLRKTDWSWSVAPLPERGGGWERALCDSCGPSTKKCPAAGGKGYCPAAVVFAQPIVSRLEVFLRLLSQWYLYGRATSLLTKHAQVVLQYTHSVDVESWAWIYTMNFSTSHKGALCRSFFPEVEQRLQVNLPITPAFTAMVSGHGKTKSYLHRFGFIDSPMCPCKGGDQTPEHLIYHCNILETQRKIMKQRIKKCGGTWPTPPTRNW